MVVIKSRAKERKGCFAAKKIKGFLLASLLLVAFVRVALLPAWYYATTLKTKDGQRSQDDGNVHEEWSERAISSLHDRETLKLPNEFPRQQASSSSFSDFGVTLTVQTGVSGFRRLLFMIQRWGGPVSASIRLTGRHDIEAFRDFRAMHVEALRNTTIHLLIETPDKIYPHNILREMALENIETNFFLALDVDFVTPMECHDKLHSLIADHPELDATLRDHTLLVLPAFNHEVRLADDELKDDILPNSKEELIRMVEQGSVTEFHVQKYFPGHGPTNFSRWYQPQKENSGGALYYPIDYMMGFEPYVLAYREGVPHYWEGFRGHGYNKVSWYIEAHYKGYAFAVLHDFFVIHLDHAYVHHGTTSLNMIQANLFRDHLVEAYNADLKDLQLVSRGPVIIWLTKLLEIFV